MMKKAMPVGRRAFTLIELLVVIALIGILSTLVMANLNSARERSRDVQRKADLRSVQTAMRLYYNDHGSFPTTFSLWGSAWVDGTNTYMNEAPKDPLASQNYKYTQIDADNYKIEACLENKSDEKGVATTDTGWCPSAWEYIVKP